MEVLVLGRVAEDSQGSSSLMSFLMRECPAFSALTSAWRHQAKKGPWTGSLITPERNRIASAVVFVMVVCNVVIFPQVHPHGALDVE